MNEDHPDGNLLVPSSQGLPDWSPDGKYVAFLDSYEPPEAEDSFDSGTELTEIDIFVADVNSGEIRNYTENMDTVGVPVWSPDGKTIAFVSREFNIGQIYLIDVETANISEIPTLTQVADRPTWSPDGHYLAFTSNSRAGVSINAEVMILDMATYELRNISNSEYYDNQPTWSPDASFLAFVSRRINNQDEIFIANIQTGSLRRLTDTSFDESDITWRPR